MPGCKQATWSLADRWDARLNGQTRHVDGGLWWVAIDGWRHRVQLVGELLLELLVRGSNPSGVGLLLESLVRGWNPTCPIRVHSSIDTRKNTVVRSASQS
jgi:hypothetical protein